MMKFTFLIILGACLQVSAKSYAQQVSLHLSNTTIKKVFYELTRQTGYSFICEAELINQGKPISIHADKLQLNQVLSKCFEDVPVDIIINKDNTVFIKRKVTRVNVDPPKADITITGKITDEKNAPLPGVTVKIKDTKTAVISDKNGAYKIVASDAGATLVFTSIGYVSQEIKIAGNTVINVRLKEQSTNLNETVVIGYATQARRDLTGAVSSVNAGQLKDIPVNSAAMAITGKLAGVRVSTSEGGPGAGSTIRIRGGGSITQDNSPLYVIDGIQVEQGLSAISPQDIESIDVLKDAASTAIYGARGANGVVIITTKGGKPMKTTITLNSFVGMNKLARRLELMNPRDFIEYQYERIKGTNQDSLQFVDMYGDASWGALDIYRNKENVDWQGEMFGRNAFNQTHNLSVTGGNAATTFNISLTKNREESVMINSLFDRNLANFKFDHKVSDKLKIGLNFRYNQQTINGSGTSAAGASMNNRLRHTIKYRPFLTTTGSPLDFDQAYFDQSVASGVYLINPILLSNAEYRDRNSVTANISGYLNYKFNDFLSFQTTVGTDRFTELYKSFDDYITWNALSNSAGQPMAGLTNSSRNSVNVSNVLNFNNRSLKSTFHRDHSITALLGQEIYQNSSASTVNQLRYFPRGITPEKALGQLSLGTSMPLYPSSTEGKATLSSFFGRLNYSYKGKYLATATFRADGSSKFAPGKQWGYFPSAALAWRISDEQFFKNVKGLSDLKLRLSYGLAGNNRISDFLYTSLYSATASPYGLNDVLVPGYMIAKLANPALKWETTVSKNIGLDFTLLKVMKFTLDAYENDTRDLLIDVPVASNSGYTTQLQNVGSTRNRGIELQLSSVLIAKKDFNWSTNFNISSNQNKITALSRVSDRYYVNSGWGISTQLPDFAVQVGQPVGTMYGFVTDGYYQLADFDYDRTTSIYTLKAGVADVTSMINTPQPGMLKLKDLNGDGIITSGNDMTNLGNSQPKFHGGWGNQLTYKNFDFSVFLDFTYGNKVLNADKIEFSSSQTTNTNMLATMNSRWRTIDQDGNLLVRHTTVNGKQAIRGASPEVLAEINKDATIWQPLRASSAFLLHSWAIEDGSFLRVNNVTLGYTLPKKLSEKAKISALRIYGTVNNLAIITGYSGYDPEVSTKNSAYVTPGVDSSPYPRSRAFIVGINAKF